MAGRPYVIRTDVQRVVYTRPATLPKAAPGAATGFDSGSVAYDRAPPVELATIVHYPDARGVIRNEEGSIIVNEPQVVTISRAVPTISRDGTVRTYDTAANFVASVLAPFGLTAIGQLTGRGRLDANGDPVPDPQPGRYTAGSPYRWVSQTLAAQSAG